MEPSLEGFPCADGGTTLATGAEPGPALAACGDNAETEEREAMRKKGASDDNILRMFEQVRAEGGIVGMGQIMIRRLEDYLI